MMIASSTSLSIVLSDRAGTIGQSAVVVRWRHFPIVFGISSY
jgi:hypothetical protein